MIAGRALAAVVLVAALSACGQDDQGAAAGSEALVAGVAQVSQAATAGDTDALDAAADRLRALVRTGVEDGSLDEARGAAVLDQLDRVLADVAAASPTPVPTTTSPAPTTGPEDGAGDGGKGGDGKGGGGKDDGERDDDEPGKKGKGGRDEDD